MFVKNKFELNDKEVENVQRWLEEHAKKCPHFGPQTARWLGSPIHYIFTPSGVGDSVSIKCNCGAEADVSDCENL